MEKLLPCPFCGGEAEQYIDQYDKPFIECTKCYAQMHDDNPIAAWNTRAVASASAEREALEKIVAVYDDDHVREEQVAPRVYAIATAALSTGRQAEKEGGQ